MTLSLGAIDFDLGVKVQRNQFRSANDNLLKMQKQIANLTKDTRQFQIAFSKSAREIAKATGKLSSRIGNLRRRVFSLKGAFIGLGAGFVAKGFLDVARETENLQVRLKFLTSSADEAALAFASMNTFASQVPFTLREIQGGGAILLTLADNAGQLNELLGITADIAAATGLTFNETAQQIQRSFSAGIASADLFRERAVGAMLGFEQGATISAQATRDQIIAAFRDGTTSMKGAAAEMAGTFDGTMSQISDKWFQFRRAFMDSAPFDFIKSAFIVLNNDLNARFGDIENAAAAMGNKFIEVFKKMALGAAGFVDLLEPIVAGTAKAVNVLIKQFNELPTWMQQSGIVAGLIFGKKGIAALAGIAAINKGLDELSGALDRVIVKGLGVFGFELETLEEIEAAQAALNALAEQQQKIAIGLVPVPDLSAPDKTYKERVQEIFGEIQAETARRALKIEIRPEAVAGKSQAGVDFANMLRAQQRAPDFREGLGLEEELTGAQSTMQQTTAAQQILMDKFAEGRGVIAANVTEIERYEMDLARLVELQSVGAITTEQMAKAQLRLQKQIETTNPVMATFTDHLENFADPIVDAMFEGENAFEAFKQTAINTIKEVIKEMIKLLIMKKLADAIGGAGGRSSLISINIGKAAEGGPISGPTLVGEKGPEIFLPNGSGMVLPNDMLQAMMVGGSGGGGNVSNSNNTTIVNDLRGSNGDASIQEAVANGIKTAAPHLIGASVNAVRDERQSNPQFFGGQGL